MTLASDDNILAYVEFLTGQQALKYALLFENPE